MEWFKGGKIDNIYFLRLDRGDDIQHCVEELAKKEDIQSGAVISGIATLYETHLHMVTTTDYNPVEEFVKMKGALEVTSINGIIADYQPHLHITVSDTKQAYAGHLEPGCLVLYLAELVIVKFAGIELTRVPDEYGIKQLKAKE